MFIELDNTLTISTEAKILFREKLNYVRQIINDTAQSFNKLEQIEENYWVGIGDVTELNRDDFEYHKFQVELLKDSYNYFPQILFKSLIVSIYSILETTISDSRISIEKVLEKEIKFKHLKSIGSEIENSINYFRLVYKINFDKIGKDLFSLKNYAEIRNNIVHRNGNLKYENQNRRKIIDDFVKINNTVAIKDESLIIVNQKFILDFLDFSNTFMLKYFETLIVYK